MINSTMGSVRAHGAALLDRVSSSWAPAETRSKWLPVVMLARGALAAVALLSLAHLAQLCYVISQRIFFPFDVEWLEGAMLCSALRVLEGHALYAEPSAEFISLLYTPLYPALLAGLASIWDLSYGLARSVSVVCFGSTLFILAWTVYRESEHRFSGFLLGLVPIGVIAAAFPLTGAWYDLARSDSLCLLLITLSLYLLRYHAPSRAWLVAAGVLAGAAFLAKQTASIFIVMSGAYVVLMQRWRAALYVGAVGVVAGGTTLVLNQQSDGWFWRYIFEMHQAHDFDRKRLWPITEQALMSYFPVAGALFLVLAAVALVSLLRRRWTDIEHSLLYWLLVALVGIGVAATGYSTAWAGTNAFIPGVLFPALFLSVAVARLEQRLAARQPFASLVRLAVGGALAAQLAVRFYDLERWIPDEGTRQAGERLVALIASIDGPVLIPSHPFYAVLAGKEPMYQAMGIPDVTEAGYPFPADLRRKIEDRYFGAMIFDFRLEPPYPVELFAGGAYRLQRRLQDSESPRPISGARVRPRFLYVPAVPPSSG
jgi:hypothetical protein